MLFNSLDFAIYLPIVFTIYWLLSNSNLKIQNFFVLVASYFFYGWWDWRFLSLILFSSLVDYTAAILIDENPSKSRRKTFLLVSILVNLGFLGFFKYFNFFAQNFVDAFAFFGQNVQFRGLEIVLPVGISFYTFQSMSYTIDVYRGKMRPSKDIIAFLAYVSYFPQLVAGPIERATQLLPQFMVKRKFNYENAISGSKQILWGLVKKVIIADQCAVFANQIFNNYEQQNGYTLFLGAIFFTFQIYGDFSGYSDIAIGTSRLFGINLMQNFAFPYFSRDIAEFWRRWHISLSTWFRDYIYIPLGGSRGSFWLKIKNVFIIFLVSGFWHGANWTFIIWGALNALYFLPLMIFKLNRHNLDIIAKNKVLPGLKEFLSMLATFFLTVFAWIFFRSVSVEDAFSYISKMFYGIQKNGSEILLAEFWKPYEVIIILLVMFNIIEWFGREKKFAIDIVANNLFQKIAHWIFYYVLLLGILYFFGSEQEFIYFQF